MALTEQDVLGLTIEAEHKPDPNAASDVEVSQVSPMLIEFLKVEVPKALADPKNYRLNLRLPLGDVTEFLPEGTKVPGEKATPAEKENYQHAVNAATEAKTTALRATLDQLAGYTTGWGKVQEPKLYIHKTPLTKAERASNAIVVHMKVEKWDDVPLENRPGRGR